MEEQLTVFDKSVIPKAEVKQEPYNVGSFLEVTFSKRKDVESEFYIKGFVGKKGKIVNVFYGKQGAIYYELEFANDKHGMFYADEVQKGDE